MSRETRSSRSNCGEAEKKSAAFEEEDGGEEERENSRIISSNIRAFLRSSSSSSEADTQVAGPHGTPPRRSLSSTSMKSASSLEDMMNQGLFDSQLQGDSSSAVANSPDRRKLDPGYRIPKLGKTSSSFSSSRTSSSLRGRSPRMTTAKRKEEGEKKPKASSAFDFADDSDDEERNGDPELKVGSSAGDGGLCGLSLKSLLKKVPQRKEDGEKKRMKTKGDDGFHGFSQEEFELTSPKKAVMKKALVRMEQRKAMPGGKRTGSREDDKEEDADDKEGAQSDETNRKGKKVRAVKQEEKEEEDSKSPDKKRIKASSVFDVDQMLDEELDIFKAEAKTMQLGKGATKAYVEKQRKMINRLRTKKPTSPRIAPRKRPGRKVPKGQRTMRDFLSSPGPAAEGEGKKSPISNILDSSSNSLTRSIGRLLDESDGSSSDENEEAKTVRQSEEEKYRRLLISADQIANTRDISQNFDSVDEYVLKLQEMNEEEESRSREETEVDEEKKRREEEKERYRGENWNIKLRMDSRLGEKQIRRLLGKNTGYLQAFWDGEGEDVENSSRFLAYRSGGRPRAALLYTTITHPFTDHQIEWAMDELRARWMPTEREYYDRNDFAWKVVLPEALIKVYMDVNGIASKEEAEDRIAKTPLRQP